MFHSSLLSTQNFCCVCSQRTDFPGNLRSCFAAKDLFSITVSRKHTWFSKKHFVKPIDSWCLFIGILLKSGRESPLIAINYLPNDSKLKYSLSLLESRSIKIDRENFPLGLNLAANAVNTKRNVKHSNPSTLKAPISSISATYTSTLTSPL